MQFNHLIGLQSSKRRSWGICRHRLRCECPQSKVFSWGLDLFDSARILSQLGNDPCHLILHPSRNSLASCTSYQTGRCSASRGQDPPGAAEKSKHSPVCYWGACSAVISYQKSEVNTRVSCEAFPVIRSAVASCFVRPAGKQASWTNMVGKSFFHLDKMAEVRVNCNRVF